MNKLGYGILTLQGKNTASLTSANGISIANGILKLDFANSAATDPIFTVTNGLLLGNGTISGSVGAASSLATGGATLALVGKSGQTNSQTLGVVTNAAKDNSITLSSNGGTVNLTLGVITNTLGGTIAAALPTSGAIALAAGQTTSTNGLLVDANANPYVIVGGADWGAKNASNNLVAGSSIVSFYTANTATALTASSNADITSAVTLAAGTTVASLRFDTASALTLNLGGNTLVTGGILIGTDTSTSNQVISNGSLQGTQLTLVGKNLAIYQANPNATLTISAVIANNTAATTTPATALSKAGPGTLILTGTNTYTGVTYFNGGVISVASVTNGGVNGSLGAATNVTGNWVFSGGTLQYTGGNGTTDHGATFSAVSAIDVTQAGTTLTLQSSTIAITGVANTPGLLRKIGAGTLALGGSTAANSNLSVQVAAGTLNLAKTGTGSTLDMANGAALIVDTGATAKVTGSSITQLSATSSALVNGTFDLNGVSQTFDGLAGLGTVTSATGTPVLSLGSNNDAGISAWTVGAAAAGVASTGLNYFSGNITGTIALTKIGAGTQILNGSGNTYAGATTINSGTLRMGAANALPTTTNVTILGNIVVGGIIVPGTLDLGGNNLMIGGLSSSTGGIVTSTPTLVATAPGVYNASGVTSGSITNTLTIGNGGSVTFTYNGIFQDGYSVVPGTTPVGVNGILALNKTGAGIQILTGANTATGLLTVSQGELDLNTSGTNSWAGNVTITATGLLKLLQSNQISDARTITAAGGTFELNGNSETVNGVSLTGGSITDTATGGLLASLTNFDLQSGSASAALGGSVAAVKTTSGTVILSGTNTYNGGTNINGGILQVNSAGALGSTGTISFGGGTLRYSSGNTTDYSSRFSSSAGQSVSVDTNGQTVTFASNLTNSGGSLTKLGNGTLNLNGSNSLDGTVAIQGGTVSVGTVFPNTPIPTAQPLGQGTSAIILGNATTPTGTATLQYTGASDATLDRGVTLANGDSGTIRNTGGAVLRLGSTITGSASSTLNISGAGSSVVSIDRDNAATMSGNVTVTSGTLAVNNPVSPGASGTGTGSVNVSGGKLTGAGSLAGAVTVGPLGTVAPGTITGGVGTLTFGTTLTVGAASGAAATVGLRVGAAQANDADNFSFHLLANDFASYVASAGATQGSWNGTAFTNQNFNDQISGGSLILNATTIFSASFVTGPGAVLYTPKFGDVIDLGDWTNVTTTSLMPFPSGYTGGPAGNFNLPDLSGSGLAYDFTAFGASNSLIVVVVPEPGRALLLLLGLGLITARRRRRLDPFA